MDPSFYSSEFVARDAEVIRQQLNISELSVYGVSYGTIPATIYASLFPKATRALVLEGVVNTAQESIISGDHRRRLLQRMIDKLPSDVVALMSSVTATYGLSDEWFSVISRNLLTSDDGLANLDSKMRKLTDPTAFSELLTEIKSAFTPITFVPHPVFTANEVAYFMISCQELGLAEANATTADSFASGKLSPKLDSVSKAACDLLGVRTSKLYDPTKYPVTVPVTYFQGSTDSATSAAGAIHHYKTVPKSAKQLLIRVNGGHPPNNSAIRSKDLAQAQIFTRALLGQQVPMSLVEEARKSQKVWWSYTSKNF
ncbi:MAG: alpha/beta fold hydrolase [Proteobacteria bacterium]|nr:MAG: alpha/beta fold hydrolase [Pseudomonadota bacterium]